MKYSQYLQGGGTVSPVQALIESVINSQGQDQEALQKLVELAEAGDEEALAFIQELQKTQTPQAKCGSKLRKKAELGTKLKVSRNGCKCATILKKQGGQLIEVDSCTGLPVHQSGGDIKKFQNPGSAITFKGDGTLVWGGSPVTSGHWTPKQAKALQAVLHYTDNAQYYYLQGADGNVYMSPSNDANYMYPNNWRVVAYNDVPESVKGQLTPQTGKATKGANGIYTIQGLYSGSSSLPKNVHYDPRTRALYVNNQGTILYQDSVNGALPQGGGEWREVEAAYKLSPELLASLGFDQAEKTANSFYYNDNGLYKKYKVPNKQYDRVVNPTTKTVTYRLLQPTQLGDVVVTGQKPATDSTASTTVTKTTQPGLFTGDLRSLAARKEWVKNNADFLKSEYNWDANRIANYKGDARDNLQLKKAIAAKQEKDAAWAAKKPEGYDEMLTAIRPTTAAPTPAQVVVPAKLPFRKNGGKFNYSDYLK